MNLPQDADAERRFGGLRRLVGDVAYGRLRGASVAVVGLGGVGSWAAEALARSGVARLVLIDLDHVSESNINRQVQALGATVGQHKGDALRARIADIHPGCRVQVVDAFVDDINWPGLLAGATVDVLIDACDQVRAKRVLATWALQQRVPIVTVGAAGGKRLAQRVEVDDLSLSTHDPLLASLRQRLRQDGVVPRKGLTRVRCVYSREPVTRPEVGDAGTVDACAVAVEAAIDGSLNCHGYGSSVTVTATFGLVAAGEAIGIVCAGSAGAECGATGGSAP
ncbi:MAG: ThiF family adenylyltransferase [Rubrivivax sp.]